jgi:hypothetical protein
MLGHGILRITVTLYIWLWKPISGSQSHIPTGFKWQLSVCKKSSGPNLWIRAMHTGKPFTFLWLYHSKKIEKDGLCWNDYICVGAEEQHHLLQFFGIMQKWWDHINKSSDISTGDRNTVSKVKMFQSQEFSTV